MFSSVYVKKNEIALEFKKGEIQAVLSAGNHFSLGLKTYRIINISQKVEVDSDLTEYLLRYRKDIIENNITIIETKHDEIGVFYKNGMPSELILPDTRKLYWTQSLEDKFEIKKLNQYGFLPQDDAKELFKVINHPKLTLTANHFEISHIKNGFLGFLYINNTIVDILAENQYFIAPAKEEPLALVVVDINNYSINYALSTELEHALPHKIYDYALSLKTNKHEIGLHYDDGNLLGIYPPNTNKLFLKKIQKQEIKIIPYNDDRAVSQDIIKEIEFAKSKNITVFGLNHVFITKSVTNSKILLEIDGKIAHVLQSGTYGFWNFDNKVKEHVLDERIQSMEVSGQEILTKDKVNLRVNLVANWQYENSLKAFESLEKPQEFLYKEFQFGLREAVGTRTLDELLENKTVIDEIVQNYIKDKVPKYGFNIISVGVKDIILPGEMKEILAQVVQAEKSAQANVIKRREETSATRSLLNTAKVMENNPIALRLKEMETLEKIAEKIEHLNVVGGLDQVLHGLVNIQPKNKNDI